VRTHYPWNGQVTVHIVQTPDEPWTLSLRIPRWSGSAVLTGPDGSHPVSPGAAELSRSWRAGEHVVLDLDLPVRVTDPDPYVDAVRGCFAVERGPLVYCVESVDVPAARLEDLRWDASRDPTGVSRTDIGDAVVGVDIPVVVRDEALVAPAIPYYAWANRQVDGMRVWIPR
jgi:uncharacterized protein